MAEDSYAYHKLIVVGKGYYESGDGKYYNKGKHIVARQLNDSLRWVELDESN